LDNKQGRDLGSGLWAAKGKDAVDHVQARRQQAKSKNLAIEIELCN